MYELVFLTGQRAGIVVPCNGTLIAGREATCSLEVPDPRVSRSHARVTWDGSNLEVADSNSSNGTFVNDKPIKTSELNDGDVLRLGTTRLRVRLQTSTNFRRRNEETMMFGMAESEPRMTLSVPIAQLEGRDSRAERTVLQHRLGAMIGVSEMLAKIEDLHHIHEPVLEALFDLLPQSDRGFLLIGNTVDDLEPRAMRQRSSGITEMQVSRSICKAALDKKAAIVYREGADDPIDAGHSVANLQIRSAVAVPLTVGEEIIGLVVLDTKDPARAFNQEDLELAAAVCHQVAIAIKNRQLVREVEDQTRTRANLMRFLPPAIAEQVLKGEIDGGLGGAKYRGTVMFSDLIGFTRRSERLSPEELVASMNDYFSCVVPCIERDGGSIDKFMGDAIMAVWGIPLGAGDAAQRAVGAALSMQTQLMAFNSDRPDEFHMGIGVNSGEVIAGNIGAGERLEYTVLGDVVNTAQRIETCACREQVLVTAATWNEIRGKGFGIEMPPLEVKNKSEPVQAFSVRALAGEHDEVHLFLPVESGSHAGWLIRRLADDSFVLLHDEAMALPQQELTTAPIEWCGQSLGRMEVVAELGRERDDGALRRTQIQLPDPTLAGLLTGDAIVCTRTWREMNRDDSG